MSQSKCSEARGPSGRKGLEGVRVGLLEARMSSELAELVRRHGGVPNRVPAVREGPVNCAEQVAAFLDGLDHGTRGVVVFLTGAGATALFREAEHQGRLTPLLKSLSGCSLVCRGPKPTAAIKRHGLTAALSVTEPYTSHELLQVLHQLDLHQTDVTLVHYGERSEALSGGLRARGALLTELCLYEWLLPEDLRPLQQMVRDVIDHQVDALVFTSQIQCRHLFQVAAGLQLEAQLTETLNSDVVVAVVGPICRAAVEAFGVTPHVEPENPKMGPLVCSLANHFARRNR